MGFLTDMEFTEEQQQIFDFVKNDAGHGIIDAVAGAGKTTTIMECARYVGDESELLFCAFNTSISAEILRKFRARGLNEVTVKTIHALGWQMLLEHNSTGKKMTLDDSKYEQIFKSDDLQERARPHFDGILELNGYDPLAIRDARAKAMVDNLKYRIKNKLLDMTQKYRSTLTKDDLQAFKEMVHHFGIFTSSDIAKEKYDEELAHYFSILRLMLEQGNRLSERTMIIDYTDMLYLPYIWQLKPQRKYGFLFIDECQDLSKAQFAIATKYGRKGGRVLAVGDPQQSIYGFTGADIESFDRVREYTRARQFPLTKCFRCPQKVIALAREIREDITGVKEEEGEVTTITIDEVVDVAVAGDLIISRLRTPLLLLVFRFIDKNIRVHIHQEEAREIIKELKLLFKQDELNAPVYAMPGEFAQLKHTVLSRHKWMINKNAERIADSAERKLFIDKAVSELEQKLEFLHKKYELWKADCGTVVKILERIKDYITATHNAVNLSTIHRAKGLESDRVFILYYEALPHKVGGQKEWQQVQERNLKYVAVTRARKVLYLVEVMKILDMEEDESLFDNMPFDC